MRANNIDVSEVGQLNDSNIDVLSTNIYDNQHDLISSTDASGQTTSMTYNAQGQVLSITDPLAETTTLTYNTDGTLAVQTLPAAEATTTYTYDVAKRVTTVTDSEGYVLTFGYDNLDRPVLITYPDGTTSQAIYGLPTSTSPLDVVQTIDRQNRSSTATYDPIREVLSETDPLNRTSTYTWCTCGGMATLTDANHNTTTWNHDIQGRITEKIYPDQTQTSFFYDGISRTFSQIDANNNTIAYSYAEDNNLLSISYTPGPGVGVTPNVAFTYDPVYNRVITMADGTGTTNYTYNPVNGQLGANRLASVSTPIYKTGSVATLTYSYDALGRVISHNIDGSNLGTASFDTLGRVTSISNLLGQFSYAYVDTTTRLKSLSYPVSTGLSTTLYYFPNVSPSGTGNGDQRLQQISNKLNGNVLSQFSYTYNPIGTIATWVQQADANVMTYNISYDLADQLISAVQTNSSSTTLSSDSFSYDLDGNRLQETTLNGTSSGTFNALNELTKYPGPGITTVSGQVTTAKPASITVNGIPATLGSANTYSASVPLPPGQNLVSVVATDTQGNSRKNTYSIAGSSGPAVTLNYDANGNILQDERGDKYTWDALNRLTSITYPSGLSSTYAYDGLSRRVSITDPGAQTSKNYLWAGNEMVDQRDSSNNVQKRFYPQGEQIANIPYFYTKDHLGSVRELISSTGAIVSRLSYDVYGKTTLVQGTDLATFKYEGMYWHVPSQNYQCWARIYDPSTGTWRSRDPVGENAGTNLYVFLEDDPMDDTDLDGTSPKKRTPKHLPDPPELPPGSFHTCYKYVLMTMFHDRNGYDDNKLGPGDLAVGNTAATDANKRRPSSKAAGLAGMVIPWGTPVHLYPEGGTPYTGRVHDWGAYNLDHPDTPVDGWIDRWQPRNPDGSLHMTSTHGWISINVANNCNCPKGWQSVKPPGLP